MTRKTHATNKKLNNQPAVLPAMPAQLVDKAFFGGRLVESFHVNNGQTFEDEYVSTGVFPRPQGTVKQGGGQAKSTVYKALSAYFDLDLVDLVDNDEYLGQALAYFNQEDIAQVFANSDGRAIDLVDVSTTPIINNNTAEQIRTSNRHDVIKAWLVAQPESTLLEYCESVGGTFVDQLIELIGKPNIITYTGTGLHLHYHIADNEGWTSNGIQAAGGDSSLIANRLEMKSAYRQIVDFIGKNNDGLSFDAARCDVGLGVMRDIGSSNNKSSVNGKTVREVMGERCDATRRITLEDLRPEAVVSANQPKRKTSARDRIKTGGSASSGNGTHDARVKRVKARLKADAEVTFLNAQGDEVTFSVDTVMELWDEMKAQGVVVDDGGDKLKCRLDWVSNGSINAWARKDAESGAITFICDVEKYLDAEDRHVFNDNGKLVGKWVYEGSLRSQLMFTPKGALIRNLHNYTLIMQIDKRLQGQLRRNSRTDGVEVSAEIHRSHRPGDSITESEAKQNKWFPLTDGHAIYIKMCVESFYTQSVSKDDLYAAIDFVAGMNSQDDVQVWLDAIQWDGKRRLDGDNAWLCEFMGIKRDEGKLYDYYEFVGRAMILAIVRNIYAVNGHPVSTQHMALMRGGQNFGKSLMASVLAATDHIGPRYFAEMNNDLLSRGSGDIILALSGKTVIEIPELSAFSKKDAETVKNFITQRTVEGRKAFSRCITRMEKSTYMIGNTNKYKPLTDPTGNRRFLMIDFYNDYRNARPGRFQWDRAALTALVPQLYAEAYQRAVMGVAIPEERKEFTISYCGVEVDNWNLAPKEVEMLNIKNEGYTNTNATTEAVYDIVDKLVACGHTRTTIRAIRKELKEEYQITAQSNIQINEALANRNWQARRVKNIRCFEFMGELPEEPLSTIESVMDAPEQPRDVAKSGDGSQMSEMLAKMNEMMAQMNALMAENKELKEQLAAKDLRPEPRRQAPKARKSTPKPAPAKAPVAKAIDITAALDILTKAGKGDLCDRYRGMDPDSSRGKTFATALIGKANALQA